MIAIAKVSDDVATAKTTVIKVAICFCRTGRLPDTLPIGSYPLLSNLKYPERPDRESGFFYSVFQYSGITVDSFIRADSFCMNALT